MHLIPRQENGGFAAYYYCSKAELYDAEIPDPPPRRHRRDGFGEDRQEQFLELIRGGASGREAARRIHISPTTAYNLYNSPDGAAFRQAWDEAARVTDIVLEDTAFDRAVNGQEEIVYHQGRRVGVRWRYDNNLLMRLLRARNPLKYAPLSEIEGWLRHRGLAPPADVDGALDRLRAAEAEWGRRLPGEDALPGITDQTGASARSVRAERAEECPSEVKIEIGPSTGSGPTEQAGTGEPPTESTSSTSSETGQPAAPPVESTSSTSSGNEQSAAPSAGSASPAQEAPVEPTSPPAPSTAEAPEDARIFYRPPPRPRLISP